MTIDESHEQQDLKRASQKLTMVLHDVPSGKKNGYPRYKTKRRNVFTHTKIKYQSVEMKHLFTMNSCLGHKKSR